jgi:hypothetical protein
LAIGLLPGFFSLSRSRCSEGGFGLWLGDNSDIVNGKTSTSLHILTKRALYGLKQAPRAWYARIDSYLLGLGFTKSEVDPNLYYIVVEGKSLILVLYLDNLILTGVDSLIQDCKEDLARKFEMKDLGLMHYFLGLEVWQGDGETFLGKGRYAEQILRRFHMQDCRAMATPLVTNWRKVDTSRGEG